MTCSTRTFTALAVGLLAAASLSACASRPKPLGPIATASTPAPPPPPYAAAPPSGEVTSRPDSGVPIPGSERDFVINAGDRVYFDFDRFTVRDDGRSVLDAEAAWLNRYPAVRVRIEGNCDDRGTREYNFALGARRANTVREYLLGHGISPGRIDTVSYGKEHPIDAGATDEAAARNRNARTAIADGAR